LLAKGNLSVVMAAAIFFLLYNVLSQLSLLDFMDGVGAGAWFGNASNQSLVMLGVLASALYKKYSVSGHLNVILAWTALGLLMLLFGFLLRPYGGISKIRSTPAWVGICAGISLLAYAFFYWLVDVAGKKSWARILDPAGRSTLTCYLVPYVYYAVWSIWAITLPAFMRTGIVGLIKSLLFALLIVGITSVLNRWKISLKI
jgi:predicted acyltransferase